LNVLPNKKIQLHHAGFIVSDVDSFANNMIFEEKVADVIDPIQNARLALYKNYSDVFIELIQPLNENAFTWKSLQKNGNHFNHFCYVVNDIAMMKQFAEKYKMIPVLEPVPALLFNNKMVAFYYSRNKEVVEFLIEYYEA